MFKQGITLATFLSLSAASAVSAQYAELWSRPLPEVSNGFVYCDIGHTQPSNGRSLLYGINLSQDEFTGLRLIDGNTGAIQWSFDEPPGFYIDAASANTLTIGVSWKAGPQLLDVDNDGLDEIVFSDYPNGVVTQQPPTVHVIKYNPQVAVAEAPISVNPLLKPPSPNPTRSKS